MICVETGVSHAINRKDFVVFEKTKNLDEVGSVFQSKPDINVKRVLPLVILRNHLSNFKHHITVDLVSSYFFF